MFSKEKGQSVLEYVIVLTAIIIAVVLFANNVMRNSVGRSLNRVSNEMEQGVNRINF